MRPWPKRWWPAVLTRCRPLRPMSVHCPTFLFRRSLNSILRCGNWVILAGFRSTGSRAILNSRRVSVPTPMPTEARPGASVPMRFTTPVGCRMTAAGNCCYRMPTPRVTTWRGNSTTRCVCCGKPGPTMPGSIFFAWRCCTRTCTTRRPCTWPVVWASPSKTHAGRPGCCRHRPLRSRLMAVIGGLATVLIRASRLSNELPGGTVALRPFEIDRQAVRWEEYLPFLHAGGYDDPRWWTEAGARWRAAQTSGAPRYLRRAASGWEQWREGRWMRLDPYEAASHLTLYEAEAWCRWAGRRLPTEAEWECAACSAPESFRWGDVWEWTASPFQPFPGFESHPYRDYSAPWFDGRPVLRGASHCTQPRMRHPRYRNFFPAVRNDVPAGFRSCAL